MGFRLRGEGLLCAVNLSDRPVPLPEDTAPLMASGRLTEAGLLPPNTTVLLQRD
ncbi:hypothetical protein [Streptomyces sp. NPDC020951]|uniref:hypothetical protein n=1 Tax=Streptomyces sp. NPDC020951 TaxID=3365104 RepID=UPI0037BAC640